MNPFDQLGLAAGRIASLTSIIRSKNEDEMRLASNGGVGVEALHQRIAAAAAELEDVAGSLEAMI